MFEIFAELSLANYLRIVAEVAVLTLVIYRLYVALAETKAVQIFGIILVVAFAFVFSYVFNLEVLLNIMKTLLVPFAMMLVVFYHTELRRAFSKSFSRKRFFGTNNSADQIDSILNACNMLVEKKRGALIVFPRHSDLKAIIDSGTTVNADLSSTLIQTIFDHDTPLHDGAVIIQDGRLLAAACYLPLSEQTGIKASFGTRHRAALGLSEQTDAVVIVVSEETGAISLVYNANIIYNLDAATIKTMLINLLQFKDVNAGLTESSEKQNQNNTTNLAAIEEVLAENNRKKAREALKGSDDKKIEKAVSEDDDEESN